MCPRSWPEGQSQKKGFMEFDLYKKIIDEASPFVYDIFLFLSGESLLHKDIFEMIKYAKSKDINVDLHTNATLLNREKAYKLLESGVDTVTFSFDGYDKEAYEKIRVGADFDTTVNNMADFLKIKRELGMKKPYTKLRNTAIPNLSSFAKEEERAKRKKFLSHFQSLPLDEFVVCDVYGSPGEAGETQPQAFYNSCRFISFAMSILWDGSVVVCCGDFFGALKLGDVSRDSLIQIWNNDKMVFLRDKLAKGEYQDVEMCANCENIWVRPYGLGRFIPYADILSDISFGYTVKGKLRKTLRRK